MSACIVAVCLDAKHGFSKQPQLSIRLLEGRGVEGDAHCGETVQHLYLKRKNAAAPNRMQVHLLQSEVLDEFNLSAGDLGENITVSQLDLLHLPLGTRLHLGATAIVELTGLRTPCTKIDDFRSGLLKQMIVTKTDGTKSPRAGVMAIVIAGGDVTPGDSIRVELPAKPHTPMTMI